MINRCGFYNSDTGQYCQLIGKIIDCGFCQLHNESFEQDGETYCLNKVKKTIYNVNHYMCDTMKKMCLSLSLILRKKKIKEMASFLYSIRIGLPYIFDKKRIERYCLNYIRNYEIIKMFNNVLIEKNIIEKKNRNIYCDGFISKLENDNVDSSNKNPEYKIYYCHTYYDINILTSLNNTVY